jgi:hypothetical protein
MGRFSLMGIAFASGYLRKNGAGIGIEILVNGVLPFVVYSYARPKFGDAGGLLASMIPPLAWSVAEFVRRRRIDGISVLIVAGIALSLLAFIGGGSVRFLQLRENLVTGLIGLAFLVSAAIGRPLIYQLARASMLRRSAAEAESFASNRNDAGFRHTMNVMTVVWGAGLLLQTAIACVLVFWLPIGAYLAVSPVVGYGMMGALALWTFRYVAKKKRQARSAQEPVKE